MAGQPDPKRAARIKLPPRDYRLLLRRMREAFPVCELCEERASETAHHVVPRGQGGDDLDVNLAMLCGDGTRGCHGRVEESAHYRSKLRAKLRPETVAYAIARMGEGWLDGKYPERLAA